MSKQGSLSAQEFEAILLELCEKLSCAASKEAVFESSAQLESEVGKELSKLLACHEIQVDPNPHPHVFPDFPLGKFGVEVKFTKGDTWRSVANSVFETTKAPEVEEIFVVFGKMGGKPEVRYDRYDRYDRYENCAMHVRTSHVPRFELEIGTDESLFKKMAVPYSEFTNLPLGDRMQHVRRYARGRLKPGERLWWLEEPEDSQHSLPIQVRLYMSLSDREKAELRAEAALLCPQICKPKQSKGKYDDVALYCLTYRGVLCSQTRDLFSAGSVVGKKRGGNYVLRALQNNEAEMLKAAQNLEDALFEEYWGMRIPPEKRIAEWLERADEFAVDWTEKPSDCLFMNPLQTDAP